ncbi:hypothetical protein LTR94_037491, partial [Friedmanniomyces endolithicus]
MDAMTQQNAAMVEQTSAAARQLVSEAEALAGSVATFAIDGGTAANVAKFTPRKQQRRWVAPPEPAPRRAVNASDDWDA